MDANESERPLPTERPTPAGDLPTSGAETEASQAPLPTPSPIRDLARRVHGAVEFCGKHPFATGVFALLSLLGLLLSIVAFGIDRSEARSTTEQTLRVEAKIDKLGVELQSVEKPALKLDDEFGDINRYWKHLRYSFTREEYVNPRIVQELLGWISDSAESVTQIDLVEANQSNRFHATPTVRHVGAREWVTVEYGPREGFFAYRYIATSPSGVHMLHCRENLGGSSTFHTILLATLNADKSVDPGGDGTQTRERVMLKSLGSIVLGDRYDGEISYDGKGLRIGGDQSPMKHGQRLTDEIISIK